MALAVREAIHPSEASLRFAEEAHSPFVVQQDGDWFELPDGQRVTCSQREAIRLILLHLARERIVAPGRACPGAALIAVGWPGERILPDAAANRVKVSIARARTLGLRGLLQSNRKGYWLDERVPLRLAP